MSPVQRTHAIAERHIPNFGSLSPTTRNGTLSAIASALRETPPADPSLDALMARASEALDGGVAHA